MAKKPDKKKESKNIYTSSDVKRYMGILMEDNREQIKGISEQFVDFRRTLDSHTGMIGELAEDISALKTDVSVLKTDVSVLKEDVSVLKTDVSVIKKNTDFLEDRMKQKVNREEFIALELLVSSIKAKV